MGYAPHNVNVYLQAMAGALSGMRASNNFLVDATPGDYVGAAQAADAFAQAVDTQWNNIVAGAPSQFELSGLLAVSHGVWTARSPLASNLSTNAANYTAAAQGVVALVFEGNGVIVAEGIDPTTNIYANTGGGGSGINQLTGDVTAGPGTGSQAATVVKVNGATIPVAGGLTTGNVPQVTGGAALGYAAVNLGGGANFVSGVLPTANQASQAMGSDVSGTTAAATVTHIQGNQVQAATLGAGQDQFVATWNNATSDIRFKAAAGGGGGLTAPVTGTTVTKTTNYTLDAGGSDFCVEADTSGGAWTLTFPAPSLGRLFLIIDVKGTFSTSNLTLAQHSTEKINGIAGSKPLSGSGGIGAMYWAQSNGTDWFVQG